VKHKNIYLYLALACFVGIIVIFVFDGYLGLYDSLTMQDINYPQKIDSEQWQQQDRFGYAPAINIESGGDIPFVYELDNRRFTSYQAPVNISLWHNQTKILDIKSETLALGAFASAKFEWVLNFSDYIPDNVTPETRYDFTFLINRGDIERRVIIYISPVIIVPQPVVPKGG
jgi:hypothetical protein